MRVESVILTNFKRFTSLTVKDIPATARLVLVIGPNGSGKSSLFDAFLQWYRREARFGFTGDDDYFRKSPEAPFDWQRHVQVKLHGNPPFHKGCLYVRSSYRNEADFRATNMTAPPDLREADVPLRRMIDNDQTVSKNYQRLIFETMLGVFDDTNGKRAVEDLRDELIGDIQQSLRAVLPELSLLRIGDPRRGSFYFQKGEAWNYPYKNLSGGEKAAFDLLLDFHLQKRVLPDAIYCVDELETHIHTRMQGALLRELVRVLPTDSQLWVTTHSLGVLRAAQVIDQESPESVCLLDFDADFDRPTVLLPSRLDRATWQKFMDMMVDDLAPHLAPSVIVVCEGSPSGQARRDFDAKVLNRIFGQEYPHIAFVSGGSGNEVEDMTGRAQRLLQTLLPATRVLGLVDRDDRTEDEIADLRAAGIMVLSRRTLESYLLGDDVLKALAHQEGHDDLVDDLLRIGTQSLAASVQRGNPADDLKMASGDLYTQVKKLLGLKGAGNNAVAFMRDVLAPLIIPGMEAYETLRCDLDAAFADES